MILKISCDGCGKALTVDQALLSSDMILVNDLMVAENKRLQAIIDKYPKTADGVPMVYGDQVWWWEDNAVQRGIWRGIGYEGAQVEKLVGSICWPLIEWLYSTPEAAEAAKEK